MLVSAVNRTIVTSAQLSTTVSVIIDVGDRNLDFVNISHAYFK